MGEVGALCCGVGEVGALCCGRVRGNCREWWACVRGSNTFVGNEVLNSCYF